VDRLGRLGRDDADLASCCHPQQEGLDLRPWEDMAADIDENIQENWMLIFHNSEQLMTDVEELGQKLEGLFLRDGSPGSKKLNIHPHTAVPEAV